MQIALTPVQSSNIKAAGFDASTGTIRVQFHNNTQWNYHGATQSDYDKWMKADSIGSHFAKHVRPKFKSTQHQERKQ